MKAERDTQNRSAKRADDLEIAFSIKLIERLKLEWIFVLKNLSHTNLV